MLEGILGALGMFGDITVILYFLVGTTIGFIFGIIPGLGSTLGLALALPFTYNVEPNCAMYLYAGMLGSMAFGGSIPAILIRVPGTGINIASTFDGYPMTRRGEGGKALGISAVSSLLGGIFGLIILILLLPVVKVIVLAIGPPEFFMLILWGMAATVALARGNLVKGLTSAGLGVLFSLFGTSPISLGYRWAFGTTYLRHIWGLPLIPFIIGIFAIGEMLKLSVQGSIVDDKIAIPEKKGTVIGDFCKSISSGFQEVCKHKFTFFRSSIIGTIVGIIPGVGGGAATFFSYLAAQLSSKNPEKFGQGNPEGLVAAESSNNSKDGGALLTTLAFGIPGNMETAVLLGAFMMHGISPGPMLIIKHPTLVWSLIFGVLFSCAFASTIGLMLGVRMAGLARVNIAFLVPAVIVISSMGVYLYSRNIVDVLVAIVAGFISYGLEKNGYPLVPLAIGFVLGKLLEVYFHQSLQMSWGSYSIFFTRPVSLGLFILIFVTFSLPYLKNLKPFLSKASKGV